MARALIPAAASSIGIRNRKMFVSSPVLGLETEAFPPEVFHPPEPVFLLSAGFSKVTVWASSLMSVWLAIRVFP